MGLKFDEFEIGKEYVSGRRTVTETDIVQFAGLSGDFNPLHTDELFVKEHTRFPTRIAHGALTFAIATGLTYQEGLTRGTTLGFLEADLSFIAPVYPGDTIHQVSKCIEKIETKKTDRGIVVLQRDVVNQRGEMVLKQTSKVMVMR